MLNLESKKPKTGITVALAAAGFAIAGCGASGDTLPGEGTKVEDPPEQVTPERAVQNLKQILPGQSAYGDGMRIERYNTTYTLQGVIQRCVSRGTIKEVLVTEQQQAWGDEIDLRQREIVDQQLCADGKITQEEWAGYVQSHGNAPAPGR